MAIDRPAQLKSLRLYGMATAWAEQLAECAPRPMQPEAWLDRLIDAEQADRQVRSLRNQMKVAGFPIHRDLSRIDWTETLLPKAQVEQLATAAFMEGAHDLILVGGARSRRCTAVGELDQLELLDLQAPWSKLASVEPASNRHARWVGASRRKNAT